MQSKVVFVFLVVVILATLTSRATSWDRFPFTHYRSTTTIEGPKAGLFSRAPESRKHYCETCQVLMEFLSQSTKPIKNIIGEECLKVLPDDVCKYVSKIEDFIILGIVNLKLTPLKMCRLIQICWFD